MLILKRALLIRHSESYNATTSVVNFGVLGGAHDLTAQTVLAYFRPDWAGEGAAGYLFGRSDGASFGLRLVVAHNAGSPLYVWGGHSTGTAAQPSKTTAANTAIYGAWQHVGATWNGGLTGATDMAVYAGARGTALFETSVSATANGSTAASNESTRKIVIGNRDDGARTFNGLIGYVARWNRVLSLQELKLAQSNGPLSVRDGLVMCWAGGRDYGPRHVRPSSTVAVTAGTQPPMRGLGTIRRIYVPTYSAGSSLPTLSASTYVPGSITSTGWRPRVTATY